MASVVLHAVLPLVALRAFPSPPGKERRLAVLAVLCACLPDADLAAFVFEVRPPALLAHRGLAHSLITAAVLAAIAAAAGFRSLGIGTRAWWRVMAFLFGAAASHGLVDFVTASDVGVALFAPLWDARLSSPVKVLPSCQLGLHEYLGFWGLLTIANELLYAVVPLALLVTFIGTGAPRPSNRRLAAQAVGWLAAVLVLRSAMPDYSRPTRSRVLEPAGAPDAGDPNDIPRDDLPGGKLVTRFDELRALDLFDRPLAPASLPWSSSFFPSWFGGEAGRWTEARPRLVWRTLFGFDPPTEAGARQWLVSAAAGDAAAQWRIFTLAPTEKVDLAFGRLTFPATRQALAHSHNRVGWPRYWSGRCNGVAAAAGAEREPFRVVDVIGLDGSHIRFHPNDVKSLLSVAYYETRVKTFVGRGCDRVAFDAGAVCSMNPAAFVLTVLNRIGLARQPIVIDALPTIAIQYYPVAGATVRVLRTPYAVSEAPMAPSLAGRATKLVDVGIELTLSSTTLPDARASVPDPAGADGTRYRRVGVVPVVTTYAATLAMDADSELIGGRWTGDPPDGPDHVLIATGGPTLTSGDRLAAADEIAWSFVRELARASADEGPELPTLDLRTHCDGHCP